MTDQPTMFGAAAPTGETIADKAEYVRAALSEGGGGDHHCHWTGCNAAVPPAAWGCRKHWYMLPPRLRSAIWRAFKPGQEGSKNPSHSYIAVAREVQEWIAKNHPPEPTLL